jgi:hypothetical protein
VNYRRLFVWVEGPDDLRFFETMVKPVLARRYDWITIVQYACMKDEKVRDFIVSIAGMRADYIFVRDLDDLPCASEAKAETVTHVTSLDPARIAVVKREIESWYLAALNRSSARRLGFVHPENTEAISKEGFNLLIPRRFASRVDFMMESLKASTIADARRNNGSFDYFARKYMS